MCSSSLMSLAHQNRTIAIASDFRVDGAKSPEIPQKEGVLGSEIAARNRRSLASFHRTLKSQCIIAVSCLGNRAISGVRDGHRNRKSQKSLRFRCAKLMREGGSLVVRAWKRLRVSNCFFCWERGSGGVQSTGVSQSVRETGRDESQSVLSPEKTL